MEFPCGENGTGKEERCGFRPPAEDENGDPRPGHQESEIRVIHVPIERSV